MGRLAEYRIFWRQFRDQYHTTGAILPSGNQLASALARFVQPAAESHREECGDAGGKSHGRLAILEVGPGTGAVTRKIVGRLGPEDRLDLVELNDSFVELLERRFADEAPFQAVAERCRILHQPVQELKGEAQYDLVISGLPLNNFQAADVEQILQALARLLKPGGTLSFFQYIGIRRAKALVSGGQQRQRLHEIGQLLDRVFEHCEVRRDWIWPNVPPAWVHHVRLDRHPDYASVARSSAD